MIQISESTARLALGLFAIANGKTAADKIAIGMAQQELEQALVLALENGVAGVHPEPAALMKERRGSTTPDSRPTPIERRKGDALTFTERNALDHAEHEVPANRGNLQPWPRG